MIQSKNRGFTLVELLTVIAIIGVLSSVVLSSLNDARGRGANANIKSNLSNLRAQAEIFYDETAVPVNTYTGLCGNAKFIQGVNAAHAASGSNLGVATTGAAPQTGTPPNSTTNCRANAGSWSVSAPLKIPENVNGTPRQYWCVDYTGFSGSRSLPSTNANPYTCPAS